ncbi:MAG TPA: CPBP family intramembrane metalloprotease domain-containing protein [Anaerolineae bacterium]|jgi:membrane protease YdiL (CAAX protease family)|nr:CPBP family intramembrane metalloprotease domain-containing protein [Anaerolineae bacterium]HRJ59171.1 type II CAAX endopeptidase family protein [Anaerolineales bacterium]
MKWFDNSRLFEFARKGQRLTHIAAVIPLSMIFALVAQFGVLPLIVILGLMYGFTDTGVSLEGVSNTAAGFWMGMQLIFAFVLIYAILWAWLKWVEKRPFWTLGYEMKNAAYQYGRGFLIGMFMFAVSVGILSLFGSVSFEQGDPSKQGFAAVAGVVLVLVGWIVQGGAEEVLLRGWVLPVIGARYKPWLGLLISSLIFALLHGLNPGLSVIALINLTLFGVFAGLYAMREGSLWGISALHSVWNWVQGNFFGFQVSGTDAEGGTLINLMETGQDWLTGGAFGPEGGLAVTAVLVIGMLFILFWKNNESGDEISHERT